MAAGRWKAMPLAVELPAWFSFLSPGWCVVHALAFAVVFYLGVRTGLGIRPRAKPEPPAAPKP
jgi:hypothetical protein